MPRRPTLPGKLTMPACPGAVGRARLFARLDGVRAQATWVAGPPGSGKTSLAASHLAGRPGRVLWYRCDPQDRDPSNLFHHLAQALPLGDAARSAERLADPVGLARALFRGLARRRSLPATFVFDDCHEMEDGDPFFDVLREAMRELPADRRFLFLSRRSEPAAWARLVVSGELSRIGPDELAFTEDEARALLGAGAGAADVAGAVARSCGWAAGLTLLLARHGSAGGPGDTTPGDTARGALFDYFAAEVFDRLSRATQALLLHASLYRELPAGLVEAAGHPDAGRQLDALARDRFFVTVQPGQPHGHRLHDLFREFLRHRRAVQGTAGARDAEAVEAARRLEARGSWDEAVALLLEHQRWAEAGALLRARGGQLLEEGRHRTLLAWIEDVPPAARGDDGWLDLWRGQGLLPLDPGAARQAFELAEQAFAARADPVGQVLAACGAIETWVAEWNEVAPLRALAARLEGLLGKAPALPPPVAGRAAIGLFAALMYGQPDSPALDGWVERVRALVLAAPDPGLRLEVGSHLLIFQTWWRGDLAAAGHLVDVLSPLAARPDMAPQRRVLFMAMLAGYQWMMADHDEALATVARGLALGQAEGLSLFDVLLHAQGAFAALAAGRRETARTHLEGMSARLGSRRRLDALLYHYLAAWAALADDDPDRAASHALAARGDVEASGSPFHTSNALVCAGILHDRRGDPAAASAALEQALALSRATRNRAVEYQALLHLSDQALRRGARPEGLGFLGEALGLARRQGFRSHAFWSAAGMARLYGEALEAGLEPEYATAMVRRHGLAAPPGAGARWPWRFRLQVLGATAVARDGEALAGAAGGKAVELLEVLAALGGEGVPVRAVADALWPAAEGDQARRSFDTTLHRARRLLGDEGALALEGGALSLAPGRWYVDLLDLQGVLTALVEARDPAALAPLVDRAAALWRGDPLAGRDAPWLERARRLLRRRLSRAGEAAAVRMEVAGLAPEAARARRLAALASG